MRKLKERSYRAASMDVFAGLQTLGWEWAGFDIVGSLEHSKYGTKTLRLNFGDIDIRTDREWGDLSLYHGLDAIFSNAPCAPFSNASTHFTAGRDGDASKKGKKSWVDDPRLEWHWDNSNTARELETLTYASESIMNAWNHGQNMWRKMARDWAELGYSVSALLQNNCYIGGVQWRKRFFFIAHKHPLVWPNFVNPKTVTELLEPIHVDSGEKRWLKPFMAKLWGESIKTKGSLIRVVNDGLVTRGPGDKMPSFLSRRMMPDEIPPIFMGDGARYHPTEPRYFALQEMYALCGMPDWWQPAGRIAATSHELARAVMPGVGEWVGKAVMEGLKKPPLKMQEFTVYDFINPTNCDVTEWEIEKEYVEPEHVRRPSYKRTVETRPQLTKAQRIKPHALRTH